MELLRRLWRAFDGLAHDTLWTAAHDGLATITAMVSFLAITSVYENDPGTYGAFVAVYGVVGPLGSMTFAGPGMALIQRRVRFGDRLDDLIGSFLAVALGLGVVSSIIAITFAALFIDLSTLEVGLIVISELFFNSFIFVCGMLRQAAGRYPDMIRTKIGTVLLKLVAVATLYPTGNLTIRNLAAAYVVLYGTYAMTMLFVVLPRDGYNVRLRRPTRNAVTTSAVFSVPLAAASLQSDGDKVSLSAFNFDAQAGLYAAAYRLVFFGSLPLNVIGQAAFHRFLPEGDDGRNNYHLRRAAKLTAFMFVVALATSAALYLALPVLQALLLRGRFTEAVEIVPWLLLFLPLLALSGTPMNGLLGLGRATERAAVYVSSAIVSIALYMLLIPGRGWQGAVMATLGSEAYLAVASWVAMIYYQRLADRNSVGRSPTLVPQV
ncbi:MAG: lipopolysaccharide biosynthesis protein [Acidimicrobiia bacterium]|nr:lipopolysaccharide biosynthesis protein [Acidimicrobiia bacterium]